MLFGQLSGPQTLTRLLHGHDTQCSEEVRFLLNWNISVHDHSETGAVDEGLRISDHPAMFLGLLDPYLHLVFERFPNGSLVISCDLLCHVLRTP